MTHVTQIETNDKMFNNAIIRGMFVVKQYIWYN